MDHTNRNNPVFVAEAGKGGSAILMLVPQELAEQVIAWGVNNIKDECLHDVPGKGRERSPHITLATKITDEEPEKAFKLLEKCEPFEVELGPINCFRKPEKGYDVLKIDIISPALCALNKSLLDTVEVDDPIMPYRPHLTLAYIKPYSCENLVGPSPFIGKKVLVDSCVYSDREKGGKIIGLNDGQPLKESLDYGVHEIMAELRNSNMGMVCHSALDFGRAVILFKASNKTS